MKNSLYIVVVLTLMGLFCSLTYAMEVIIPATQITQGHGSVSVIYGTLEQQGILTTKSLGEIIVAGGGGRYISEVSNDIQIKGRDRSVAVKVMVNPWDSAYYWLKLGTGAYSLEVPSTTVRRVYDSMGNGWIAALGIRARLFPDTIVSPAIAVEMGIQYSSYNLGSMSVGLDMAKEINDRLTLSEIHAASTISKRVTNTVFFGGLKVRRSYVRLEETDTLNEVSGKHDGASVFLGTKFLIGGKEGPVVEGSLGAETGISAGWSIDF